MFMGKREGEGDVIRLKTVAHAAWNTASARKKIEIAGQARNDSSDD